MTLPFHGHEPWKHQLDGIAAASKVDHFAFLWEVGTGKTRAAIETVRRRSAAAGKTACLIVTPLITLDNWRREFERYAPELPAVTVLYGDAAKRRRAYEDAQRRGMVSKRGWICAVNPEALLSDPLFECLLDLAPETLVIDELHRFKNMSAKRTKRMIKLADYAKKRLGLTGTLITRSPLDVFAQWRILDGGKAFGQNFYAFRARYFWDRNARMPGSKYFPDWVPNPDAFERIGAQLAASSMRVKKADCLDLPPLVKKTVYVEMGVEQARLYKEMRKDFIAFMGGGAVVATLAMTKALRLMQIASGFAALQEAQGDGTFKKSEVRLADNPRATALKELLETLTPDHKVIIWSVFRDNYQAIREVCGSLGLDHVEINGEMSQAGKDAAVDRFNTDPACRVLSGNPRSGGIGINLVPASYAIFYSRGFSLEDDIQAEARNYRGGSEMHEKVTRIDLVARGTIEEEVLAALAAKQSISEAVLKDIVGRL